MLAVALLALAGCGADGREPARATARIGPAGGQLVTEALTLTIPPGALSEDVDIYVSSLAATPPTFVDAYSPLYLFAPAGLEFAVPAELSIAHAAAPGEVSLYWSSDSVAFQELRGLRRDAAGGDRLVVDVEHFSRGFVGASGDCGADLGDDADNCGRCGNACEDGAACVAGECQDACAALEGDCDDDDGNGCETALDTATDCGGCGVACDPLASCEVSGDDAACACGDGAEGDGESCDDIDGCADDPCPLGVVCMDMVAPQTGYACGDCPDGTEQVGMSCADIDGCAGSPCFAGVTCSDVVAPGTGYTCGACPSGTEGDGETCSDTDGCAGSPCFAGVTCSDVVAPGTGHTCGACPSGLEGDGETCTEIDGCAGVDCGVGMACIDVPAPGTGHTCEPVI